MSDDPQTPSTDEDLSQKRGTVEFLKSALDAYKEANEDKEAFVRERLEAEASERDKRSQALYSLSQARADDMQKALDGKDKTISRLWAVVIIQIVIIAALAGVTVSGAIPGLGEIGASQSPGSTEGP